MINGDAMPRILHAAHLIVLALLATAGTAVPDEVRLISVGGVKGALDLIVADFTKATGHTVKYTVGSPLVVSQKLAAGEPFEVVVQSAPAMTDYGLKPETRVPVARGGIAVAIRADAATPDISTADGFKKTLIAARSIGVGDPAIPNASGSVVQKILVASGIMETIRSKVQVVGLDPGQQMVANGELELYLVNASEVRGFVKFAGLVPAPLQDYINYEAAVTTKDATSAAANTLVQMIAGVGGAAHWRAARLEPHAN